LSTSGSASYAAAPTRTGRSAETGSSSRCAALRSLRMDEGPRVDFFPASRPPGGAAAFVAPGASAARNRSQAKVILHASKEILAPRVPQTGQNTRSDRRGKAPAIHGADRLGGLAGYIAAI